MAESIPDLLRRYRQKRGFSQQKLAELLNTEQSYISRIERGWRARKTSDIDFLKRVSECLRIPPEELGIASTEATDAQNVLPLDHSYAFEIVELAENLRNRGDPEAAIKHLAPMVSALASEARNSAERPATTELRVRAELTLGTALGDRLPPARLGVAVRHLKVANESVTAEQRDLKVQVLRAYGNELRKSGQDDLALTTLRQARALLPASASNGSLSIALARAEAGVENWPEFRKSVADARRALDRQRSPHPLFNGLVVHEVNLRGSLAQGNGREVATELATSVAEPLNLAAQWHVIHAVTTAEALLFIGELSQGLSAVQKALAAARELSMPQQVIRIRDILLRHRKESGELADLLDEVRRELSK